MNHQEITTNLKFRKKTNLRGQTMPSLLQSLLLALPIALSGCAAMETQNMRKAQAEARQRYIKAEQLRHFNCLSLQECNKAFRIAKAYILENSDMNVQISDDTIINTFRPTQYGQTGLRAVRVPVEKEIEQITLTAECKEYTYGHFGFCDNKVSSIYEGFSPYIEQRLK